MGKVEIIAEFDPFIRAIKKNPQVVRSEVSKFLTRGMAEYRRSIQTKPWRLGGSGGGAPVDTTNLQTSHVPKFSQWEASIGPRTDSAKKYASYVHEGTSRMQARPWLDYAKESRDGRIKKMELELLDKIAYELSR